MAFQDLADDEVFVISVFRRWKAQNGARNIESSLRNEKLSAVVLSFFDFFETSLCPDNQTKANDMSFLTTLEENLLTEMSSKLDTTSQFVGICRKSSEQAGMTIRSAANIPRSHHDYLVEVIDRKTLKVFETLYRSQLRV